MDMNQEFYGKCCYQLRLHEMLKKCLSVCKTLSNLKKVLFFHICTTRLQRYMLEGSGGSRELEKRVPKDDERASAREKLVMPTFC